MSFEISERVCVVCGARLHVETTREYRGDPMNAIAGPGGRAQMTTFVETYCDECGLSYVTGGGITETEFERRKSAPAAQHAALREALGVVRGCYAALPGVDPGILAYVDGAISGVAGDRDAAIAELNVGAIHSCHDACSRPACVMRRERDEARAAVHEAEERGARWALDGVARLPGGVPPLVPRGELARRICAEARAKGGE